MSCNGCRVLRKGCSDDCMLRHCLLWIENPQAQANATVFVAKFFGRATLMSFLSSVAHHQRSALFQSLLFEAVGRTINPVNGAVGLLWTGNWHLCQLGVEKVLRGGGAALTPLPQFLGVDESEPLLDTSTHHHHHHHHRVMGSNMFKNHEAGFVFESEKKQRAGTPSEESDTSTFGSGAEDCASQSERKLLPLFF